MTVWATGTFLKAVVATTREGLAARQRSVSLEAVASQATRQPRARGFQRVLRRQEGMALIAEIKHHSPSGGVLRASFDPVAIGTAYEAAGAHAISVLTEAAFFGGTLEHLRAVRAAVGVPVLRKDFVLDPYQVYEARAAGADAVLLMAALLSEAVLKELCALTGTLGMDALVEVHTEPELRVALRAGASVVGINNRDLTTLAVDPSTAARLRPRLPHQVTAVAESGIASCQEVAALARQGFHAVLVGEALMRQPDVGAAVRELMGW